MATKTRISANTLVRKMESLPVQQSAALRVLHLLDDENASSKTISDAVLADPALASRLLRMANSAYYGLSGRVSSLSFAVTVVGLATLRSLAAVGVVAQMGGENSFPRGFWRHAVNTATAAAQVAPRLRSDRSDAFSAGLLCDLGQVLLYQCDAEGYQELLDQASATGEPVCTLEENEYGMCHASAAARLLRTWRVPARLCAVIEAHHEVSQPSAAEDTLLITLRTAKAVVARLDDPLGYEIPSDADALLAAANLDEEAIAPLLYHVEVAAAGLLEQL